LIDTVYAVVAYDGENLGSAVVTYVPLNSGAYSIADIDSTYWGTQFDAQSGTGAATVTSVGGLCTLSDTYGPYRPNIDPSHCRNASIQVSVNVTFHTYTGNSSATISALYMRSHDARNPGKVR
jgi:hypothetical protein